jgi:alpha-D-ribose 1-methylphosphonate 5-triphosphate synthase subunit PhnI
MAYVAARGGENAIQSAEALYRALNGEFDLGFVNHLEAHLPYLLDRIMGEGSLYAPELAALAVAQTGGDLYEAVLLLRAYRSTQPRIAYALPVSSDHMLTIRRISAAFKDVPGGQILGPTLDYSHRVLRFEMLAETPPAGKLATPPTSQGRPRTASLSYAFLADWQREVGLLGPKVEAPIQDVREVARIPDLTREPPVYPAPRAHRLQALARADTGGVLALGYANMRNYGGIHPTVNEVRLAFADVRLEHPVTGAIFSAGRVRVSSAEVVTKFTSNKTPPELSLGFSACLGWNETKLIAASMLDVAMNLPNPHPAHTEEFVLSHTEPVEASGFCIHYKLPHYVTFASDLDRVRKARQGGSLEVDLLEGEVESESLELTK